MSYKKILPLALLPIALYATNAMASIQHANITLNEPRTWILKPPYEQIIFAAKMPIKVDLYVDSNLKGEDVLHPADTVTVNCDHKVDKVIANSHYICELQANHTMTVEIAPENFTHGSSGTWEAIRTNK